MRDLNIKIKRRDLVIVLVVVGLLVGTGFVVAYNSGWETSPGEPETMGHSPDEIELIIPTRSASYVPTYEGEIWIEGP